MLIYSSEIVRIGDQANLFLDEGIVVFFGDNAPEELQDFAVVHKLNEITKEIVVGSKIILSDANLEVTAVGPVANENFKNLGHLVLKLDGAVEAALPGDVSCKYDKKPVIEIGDRLEITQ
jgi:PTS system glucitol/sorbitol-specific IIA component|tara:strand:- start:1019 stop:1378 length:360 start_codon:yes stop_codon:yes gene_type:complete